MNCAPSCRSTRTPLFGRFQPLVATRDLWYAPELQQDLAVTRKDPRTGTQKVDFAIRSRSEPDAGFFQPPAGFAVIDFRKPRVHPGKPAPEPEP